MKQGVGQPQSTTGGRRSTILWIGRLLATAGVLGLILWRVAPDELLATALRANAGLLLVAAGCTLVVNLVKALRWLVLLRLVMPMARYGQALRSLLVAASARLLLPGKVGEFARVVALPGLPVGEGASVTALDLLLEIQVALLLAIPGTVLVGRPWLCVPLILAVGSATFVVLRPRLLLQLPRTARALCRRRGAQHTRERAPGAQRTQERAPALRRVRIALLLGLTLGLHMLRLSQLALLLVALGQEPTLNALTLLPLIQLADAIPLTVAGFGVREWVGLVLLPLVAVTPSAAVAAVFLQSSISGLLPGLVGLYFCLGLTARKPPRPLPTSAVPGAPRSTHAGNSSATTSQPDLKRLPA